MVKRVLVGYGVDVDAVSNWINTKTGKPISATQLSRGVYGGTLGMARLLELFAKNNIKASFFYPAHSMLSYPDTLAKVQAGGHEIGLHGYTHESFGELSYEQQHAVMAASIEVIEKCTGKRPVGFTAPSWSTNEHTVRVIEEFNLKYDHSFMFHDSQMHYLPYSDFQVKPTNYEKQPSEWMAPMAKISSSKIVEIPANWYLDDWPPMNLTVAGTGFNDPSSIFQIWKDQFTFHYENNDTFVFPLTVHPDVSGKPHLILQHQKLIDWINGHEGVEWVTMDQMADEFLSGQFKGVDIEAGI